MDVVPLITDTETLLFSKSTQPIKYFQENNSIDNKDLATLVKLREANNSLTDNGKEMLKNSIRNIEISYSLSKKDRKKLLKSDKNRILLTSYYKKNRKFFEKTVKPFLQSADFLPQDDMSYYQMADRFIGMDIKLICYFCQEYPNHGSGQIKTCGKHVFLIIKNQQ